MTHLMRAVFVAITSSALVIAGLTVARAAGPLSATPTTIAGATLDVSVPTAASPLGVSPDVYYDSATSTYYLYTTSMPTGVYTSTDGNNWTAVAGASMPQGFDWSVIKMGPNDYRLYYATINPNAPASVSCTKQRKEFRYATSSDLVRWTVQPQILLDDIGCGVPHVLRKTDGSYLLYWNTITEKHGMHIATSPDGLTWTKRSGIIADDPDLVDPAPLQMPDGTFLMVASTMGAGTTQQLRILSSADGLTWSLRNSALYAPSGISVLDPSLKLIGDQLRVWFGYTQGNNHAASRIASGLLNLKSGQVDTAKPASSGSKALGPCKKVGAKVTKKGVTAVCTKVKGKLQWVAKT